MKQLWIIIFDIWNFAENWNTQFWSRANNLLFSTEHSIPSVINTPCPSAPARRAPVASPFSKFAEIAYPVPNHASPANKWIRFGVIQKVRSLRRGGRGSLKSEQKQTGGGGGPSTCVRSLFLKQMLIFSKWSFIVIL